MPRDQRIKSISVRGRTRYRVTLDVGTGANRHQQRRTFDSVKNAERWIAETAIGRQDGEIVTRQGMTLNAACTDWLAHKTALGTLRPKTVHDYRLALRCFTIPLGERPVQGITAADLEKIIEGLVAAGRTKRTIDYNRGILQQVFARLVRHKKVATNPVLAIDVAGAGRESAPLVAYTSSELAQIWSGIKASSDPLRHAYALTLHGLRLSEVVALRFSDLDSTGHITIARSRVHVSKTVSSIGAPKSVKSARRVKINDAAIQLVKSERRRQGVLDGPMVVDPAGRPIRPESYSDAWKTMVTYLGLPVHDLRVVRRSVETAMRDAGVHVHITAAVMGHSEEMSKRHYTTAHKEPMDEAIDTLTRVMQSGA